jgi:hypothetical protein
MNADRTGNDGIKALRKVLRKARRYIASDVDVLIDCACLHDPKGHPLRETMDDITRPYVERAEALLAEIDAHLNVKG